MKDIQYCFKNKINLYFVDVRFIDYLILLWINRLLKWKFNVWTLEYCELSSVKLTVIAFSK